MEAGKLRHQIILQQPGGSLDAVGDYITTWTDIAPVWASVEPLTGRDQFLAAQIQASTTHKIRLRYSSNIAAIDSSWRVLFGTRVFAIDEPPKNLEERNIEIELMCTEGLRVE